MRPGSAVSGRAGTTRPATVIADAIDLHLLRQEQTRISQRTSTLETRRRSLTANLDDWQAILETAGRFATNCGATYRHADPSTRKLFNNAVIDRIEYRDGQITHVDYRAPFDLLFNRSGFEYRTVVELRGFEPLTPCMPCHPHPFTRPSAALLSTTSALLRQLAERSAVMRREAACGIAADNLLTDRGHGRSRAGPIEARLLELCAGEVRCLRWAPRVQADPSGG
jgi:hypothetical protein